MSTLKTVCVVGGGLAGLSTAHHIVKTGVPVNVVILEASGRPGGLLRSERVGNYVFDTGGSHILFSRDQGLLDEILKLIDVGCVRNYRNAKIYYRGTYVKYPFENGLSDLPPEERFECVWGALEAYIKRLKGELKEPANFREWLHHVFGDGIAGKYLIPYNEKIWKTDLREVTLEWVDGRVPLPPLKDIVMSAVGIDVEGYTHQLTFYYPASGGMESLVKGILSETLKSGRVEIHVQQPVTKIGENRRGNLLVETRGLGVDCDAVVYTAPLKRSRGVFSDLLGGSVGGVEGLKSVPLAVVGLGLSGEVRPYHWVYLPDKGFLPHRVAVLSNFSRANAPPGRVSLIAEVSFGSEEEMNSLSDEALTSRVYDDVLDTGLLSNAELEVSGVWRWRDAYVIYDRLRTPVLKTVEKTLRERGVFLHGRFGAWEYLNMDAVYGKSRAVASEVVKYLQLKTS
ncbi:MAG: FAD-dependent oxidoreductase [Zestosphaera sp.]